MRTPIQQYKDTHISFFFLFFGGGKTRTLTHLRASDSEEGTAGKGLYDACNVMRCDLGLHEIAALILVDR